MGTVESHVHQLFCQPPCEAVSWNICYLIIVWFCVCQPPCEAVSWNDIKGYFCFLDISQPPCEAVSWNILGMSLALNSNCQPPCEAVSWNCISEDSSNIKVSASLWGCELKFWPCYGSYPSVSVSLLVRLWVEIHPGLKAREIAPVSLLVRLWVEMCRPSDRHVYPLSASLWGCELKWQTGGRTAGKWTSASLWGCELKWCKSVQKPKTGVSLLVRLWVEISVTKNALYGDTVSLLVRLWVEIEIMEDCTIACQSSASLWGCELK